MNNSDLLKLKAGMVTFDGFVREHGNYVRRLASWFHRRTSWVRSPVDQEDLVQIGLIELWKAVEDYRWRCPVCPKAAKIPEVFVAHAARHGKKLTPRPPILRYVHARVGRSMDHEMRRYVRRHKHHVDELFDYVEPSIPASQEAIVDLSMLIDAARVQLDPVRQQVLVGMAYDLPRNAHGIPPRQVVIIREDLRDGFLKTRTA